MTYTIHAFAAEVARAPDDAELESVFADALLEQTSPRWSAMGELIVMLKREVSARAFAPQAHALETRIRTALRKSVACSVPLLYATRRGLVRRLEFGDGEIPLAKLEALLQQPELSVMTELDLRRAWPAGERARGTWLARLPQILPPHLRWLGIGPADISGKHLEALLFALPLLSGLGLFVEKGAPVIDTLTRHPRVTDLELASRDFDQKVLDALRTSGMPLERLVVCAEGETSPSAAAFVGALASLPTITAFGIMTPDPDQNLRFLELLVKSPAYGRLRAFGVPLGDSDEIVSEWLKKNAKRWADRRLFTGPGGIFDSYADHEVERDALATVLESVGRDAEALAIRERVVEADPWEAWYWGNLGESLYAHDKPRALEAYSKALKLDDELGSAWAGKADVLHELARTKEALKCWDRALALDPKDAYSHHGRGLTLDELGRFEDAIAAFTIAAKLDKEDGAAPLNRGEVNLKVGRLEAAERDYERCLALEDAGEVYDAIVGLGQIARTRGEVGKARKLFERAIRSSPEDAADFDPILAELAISEGRFDQALEIYERICARPDAEDSDHEHRAWLHLELGRPDDADAMFRKLNAEYEALELACIAESRGRVNEAHALLDTITAPAPPALFCVRAARNEALLRGILFDKEGRAADAARCFRQARPASIEPARAVAPRPLPGAPKLEACANEDCLREASGAAILASFLAGAAEEAHSRADALGRALETGDPTDRIGAQFTLRRLAKAGRVEDPLMGRVLEVLEGYRLPASLRFDKTRTRRSVPRSKG